MKSNLIMTLVCALALFSSCEIIPDLNPSTSSGSAITVKDINESLNYRYINYDVDDDGSHDLEFRFNEFGGYGDLTSANVSVVNGSVLAIPELSNPTTKIPHYATQLTAAPLLGVWESTYATLKEWNSPYNIPNGKRYIFYKKNKNNKEYYGWIELQTTTANGNGHSIITRIAIAEESGVVLRAGQTK